MEPNQGFLALKDPIFGHFHFCMICPKITLGYFCSPNNPFILNWATYGAQSGFFGIERPHFWTFSLLYDGKDEMKSMLKWTTGPKSMSTLRRE